jgi:chromosome segregation ATPase
MCFTSEELEAAKVKHEATESELNSVRDELERLTGELEGIKTAVAYSESNKEDEIEAIRRQCKEEIETLQSLLNGKLTIEAIPELCQGEIDMLQSLLNSKLTIKAIPELGQGR